MRIEIGAAFQAYQKNQVKSAGSKPSAKTNLAQHVENAENTDTLELSGSLRADTPIEKQTKNIAFQLEAQGSAANLERLGAAVAKGEYHVLTQTLVEQILGGEA